MRWVRAFTYVLSCLLMLSIQWHATAQVYPANPVKLVVPFPAGRPADALGRILGEKLSPALGSACHHRKSEWGERKRRGRRDCTRCPRRLHAAAQCVESRGQWEPQRISTLRSHQGFHPHFRGGLLHAGAGAASLSSSLHVGRFRRIRSVSTGRLDSCQCRYRDADTPSGGPIRPGRRSQFCASVLSRRWARNQRRARRPCPRHVQQSCDCGAAGQGQQPARPCGNRIEASVAVTRPADHC